MADKKTYTYQGRQVSGKEVAFETGGEQWCNYTLEDGSTMKVKLSLIEVVRLEEYDEAGNPVYMFTAQQMVGIIPNPELVKKAN